MEPCLSAMWAKVTFGTFQQDSRTRSRGWNRLVVNLFWYSIKVRFPKTTPSFFPTGCGARRQRCCPRILGCRRALLKNCQTRAYTFFLPACPHLWHRTSPPLGGVVSNPPTNTPSEWRLWPPRSKRVVVQFASLTRVTSWRRKILLQPWSPLSQVDCANCIGIQTLLNGSTTLAVRAA